MVLYYREAKDGQMLEEGITEAGSMASFTAAARRTPILPPAALPSLTLLLDVRVSSALGDM
jgi:pyruvate dehydrogenase complex dehydrogenase (E1) component